jgi:hypothetical protein
MCIFCLVPRLQLGSETNKAAEPPIHYVPRQSLGTRKKLLPAPLARPYQAVANTAPAGLILPQYAPVNQIGLIALGDVADDLGQADISLK